MAVPSRDWTLTTPFSRLQRETRKDNGDPKLRSIVHPTDFSEASLDAFAHALRIAVAAGGILHVLHTEGELGRDDELTTWRQFPHAQELLSQWRLSEPTSSENAESANARVKVIVAAIESSNPAQGVGFYVEREPCDLLVLMTHARSGLEDWLHQSVAETIARRTPIPALFLREGGRGFVDTKKGEVSLKRILFPIHGSLPHKNAALWMERFESVIAPDAIIHPLHVGSTAPLWAWLYGQLLSRRRPVESFQQPALHAHRFSLETHTYL
jgi:nucleotide-binding universal stress UspA family protein